jgi:hypothetical protein
MLTQNITTYTFYSVLNSDSGTDYYAQAIGYWFSAFSMTVATIN